MDPDLIRADIINFFTSLYLFKYIVEIKVEFITNIYYIVLGVQ